MSRTKIEWTDWTINPYVGCPHGCAWCYARGQAKRQKHRCSLCYNFIPHPHLERLDQITPRQKPMKIFMDSMWDWNAWGVKKEHLLKIIEKFWECHQHIFQILSQRPKGYARFDFPDNVWLGTTMTTDRESQRVYDLHNTVKNKNNLGFVSIEPIHEHIDFWFINEGWIIVGAETGNRKGKIIPKREWIESLIENAKEEHIPIFLKDNLHYPKIIREFPHHQGCSK